MGKLLSLLKSIYFFFFPLFEGILQRENQKSVGVWSSADA